MVLYVGYSKLNIGVDIFIEVIPTAGSHTVTLLRLHFSYVFYPSRFPPSSERKNQESLGQVPHLKVSSPVSSRTHSQNVTGGVYKAQVQIHRSMLIYDY